MSEYQYYEFQAIDRPLTTEEQQAVSKLSSRVEAHPRRAVFEYHYSDLRANAKELLANYYDAMFYIANWGTTRLFFRFPQHLVDVQQIEPYCIEEYITCEIMNDYVVLEMRRDVEDGYYDWVEAAAASSSPQVITAAQLRQRIAALSRAECDEWLLRLAQGKEAQLPLTFHRHLCADGPATAVTPGRRTKAELQTLAEAEAKQIKRQQAAAAEAQRIRELEAFTPKAEASWTFAEQLIKQGTSRSYDEALQLLVRLHQLAIHQRTEAAFATRLGKIRAAYARRGAMIKRMDKANLP